MEYFKGNILEKNSKDHQTIDKINQAKIYFSGCFENDVIKSIDESPFLTLLKPLSESTYESQRKEILRFIEQDRALEISKLDGKKAQIEKEEAEERRRKAEAEAAIEKKRLEDQIRKEREEAEAQRLRAKAEQDEIIRKQQEQIRNLEQKRLEEQRRREETDLLYQETLRIQKNNEKIQSKTNNSAYIYLDTFIPLLSLILTATNIHLFVVCRFLHKNTS